jgi:hypothetical protein
MEKSSVMSVNKFYTLISLLMALLVFSCAGKKDEAHDEGDHAAGEVSVWKEMDDFHLIMAETFHPYKDSANLEPVKLRASELLSSADHWADSPLPEKVDNEHVKSKLIELKSDAAALVESTRSADDNVIAENLTKLHDTFHEIQEVWYGH